MKQRVWEILKKKYKNEKGIQAAIMDGVKITLVFLGAIVFLLLITAVKRNLGI